MPDATAVVERIRTGQIRSRSPDQAMIESLFCFSASATSLTSGLANHVTEDGARCFQVDELVTGDLRPRRNVGDRPGVGGEELHELTRRNVDKGLVQRHERPRAGLPSGVDGSGDARGLDGIGDTGFHETCLLAGSKENGQVWVPTGGSTHGARRPAPRYSSIGRGSSPQRAPDRAPR